MNIRLFAVDLDGTLVDRSGRIPEENRRAVAAALAAGAEVLIITGRSWRSTRPVYADLGLTGPAICYLGAMVVADGSGRVLRHRPLEAPAWGQLRRLALAEGLAVTAVTAAGRAGECLAADVAYATGRAPDFAAWDAWNPYTEIDPGLRRAVQPPTLAAVYGDRAVGRVLAAFPGGLPASQLDLTDRVAGEKVLHVWHAAVDKGLALAAHCRTRGIPPAAVMALGDAPMDVPMLRFAGVGVATPDGHPSVQAAADWVAAPAAAIARALENRGWCC